MTPPDFILGLLVIGLSVRLTYWRRRALLRESITVGENGPERVAVTDGSKADEQPVPPDTAAPWPVGFPANPIRLIYDDGVRYYVAPTLDGQAWLPTRRG